MKRFSRFTKDGWAKHSQKRRYFRKRILDKTGGKCFYCEKPLQISEMTIDHFIPKLKGGSNTIDNFVPSCDKCNRLKGHLDPHIFMEVKDMEKHTLKAGTIIKVKGIPYQLCSDTVVYGENTVYNYPEDDTQPKFFEPHISARLVIEQLDTTKR